MCEAGPKLPGQFKLQELLCIEAYSERNGLLEEMRRYYENEVLNEAQVEWCCEERYGRDWDFDIESGFYEWEKKEGKEKSCHVRSAKQQLSENGCGDQ